MIAAELEKFRETGFPTERILPKKILLPVELGKGSKSNRQIYQKSYPLKIKY